MVGLAIVVDLRTVCSRDLFICGGVGERFSWELRYVEIEFGQLMRAIRRFWWTPVVLGLFVGVLGFAGTSLISPTYTASSQMLVMSQVAGNDLIAGSARTGTYVNLSRSGPILDRVMLDLGLTGDYEREDLFDIIEVESIGAQIIEVRVTTDDPELSASIANSLTHHLIILATDLSIGELERNLADVQRQIDVYRERLETIEARLVEFDTPENSEKSEIQSEISLLERDRIQTSQTIADLERTERAFRTELITMTDPVVVTDDAQVPVVIDDEISPVLFGLLGGIVGGMAGVGWIVWSALTDRILRSAHQVVSLPILATMTSKELTDSESASVSVLGAKVRGITESLDGTDIVIVSPRDQESADQLHAILASDDSAYLAKSVKAGSMLGDAKSMAKATAASEAVIVAILNRTTTTDLKEVADVLAATSTRVVGTVVVK